MDGPVSKGLPPFVNMGKTGVNAFVIFILILNSAILYHNGKEMSNAVSALPRVSDPLNKTGNIFISAFTLYFKENSPAVFFCFSGNFE
jgi:hypothetical protein